MNAILASVIFYAFLFISGFKTELPLISDHKFFGVNQKNVSDIIVTEVAKNSPAESAGLKAETKIIAINGQRLSTSNEFIEIVNFGKGAVDLSGWTITDPTKTFVTEDGTLLEPGKYLVFYAHETHINLNNLYLHNCNLFESIYVIIKNYINKLYNQ